MNFFKKNGTMAAAAVFVASAFIVPRTGLAMEIDSTVGAAARVPASYQPTSAVVTSGTTGAVCPVSCTGAAASVPASCGSTGVVVTSGTTGAVCPVSCTEAAARVPASCGSTGAGVASSTTEKECSACTAAGRSPCWRKIDSSSSSSCPLESSRPSPAQPALLTKQQLYAILSRPHVQPGLTKEQLETMMLEAARTGQVSVVQECVNRGADPKATDSSGRTVLHMFACNGYGNCIEALLLFLRKKEIGINIDAQDKFGSTALHEAASGGWYSMVLALKDNGAGLLLADKDGNTALVVAKKACALAEKQCKDRYGIVYDKADYGEIVNILRGY